MASDVFRAFGGILLLLGVLWAAWLVANAVTRLGRIATRWAAWCVAAYAVLVVIFLIATAAGLLRLSILLPMALVTCVAAGPTQNRAAFRRLAEDVETLRDLWRAQPRAFQYTAAAGLVVVVVRTVRGLLRPPLAWDALTYHLFKAGRWAQSGAWVDTSAPDASTYYEHFSPYGDIVWSWALIAAPDGALLAPAGFLIWLSVIIGFADAALALGAGVSAALWGAMAVAFIPAVATFVSSGYVDNATLALLLLSVGPLHRAVAAADASNETVAATALGLLAGTKAGALPIAVVGIFMLLAKRRKWQQPARLAGVFLIFVVLAGAPLLRAWLATGSPTYPLPLRIGNMELLQGNEQLEWLRQGEWVPASETIWIEIFMPLSWLDSRHESITLGFGALFLLIPAIAGLRQSLAERARRRTTVFVLLAAILMVAPLAADGGSGLRSFWTAISARLLTIVPAAAALLLSSSPGTAGLMMLSALSSLSLLLPKGTGEADVNALRDAVIALAPMVVVVALAAFALRRLPPRSRGVAALAAVVLALGISLSAMTDIRARHRYAYYAELARGSVFELHAWPRQWAEAWPVWQALDTPEPKRVAVSAGWHVPGHNWMRYPLLGSQLQNIVVYVPVTASGLIADYWHGTPADADCRAWAARLQHERIDYLALLPPDAPELAWAAADEKAFAPVAAGEDGLARLYRVERTRLNTIECSLLASDAIPR